MKRFLCLILALAMLLCLAACNSGEGNDKAVDEVTGDATKDEQGGEDKEPEKTGKKVEGDLRAIYTKVNEAYDFESKVNGAVTLAEDGEYRDNIAVQYEIADPMAYDFPEEYTDAYFETLDKLTDYIVTIPKNKCDTFVVLRFDGGVPSEAAVKDIKDRVKAYCDKVASGISLYDQPESERMAWAMENQDLVWRQYDNALVFIFAGSDNTAAVFEAFEAAAIK